MLERERERGGGKKENMKKEKGNAEVERENNRTCQT